MLGLEQIIITFSYLGILLLMTSNGFISIPSSQFLYLIAGYFAFTGDLNLGLIIVVGALGHTIGNYVMYEIARRKGVKYSVKFIKYFFRLMDPEKEIKKFEIAFKKRSKFLLFVGKLANPSKIFISIPAGIVKMNRVVFLIIAYITSAIWASIFVFLGYYFGKSYTNFGYIGGVLLIVFVVVMMYFYRLMNSDEVLAEVENKKRKKKN